MVRLNVEDLDRIGLLVLLERVRRHLRGVSCDLLSCCSPHWVSCMYPSRTGMAQQNRAHRIQDQLARAVGTARGSTGRREQHLRGQFCADGHHEGGWDVSCAGCVTRGMRTRWGIEGAKALYCLPRSNYYSESTTVPSLPASVGKGKCTSLSQSRHLNVPVRPPNPAMGRVQMLKRGGGAPGTPHDYDIDGHPDDTLSRAHASPPPPKSVFCRQLSAREGAPEGPEGALLAQLRASLFLCTA